MYALFEYSIEKKPTLTIELLMYTTVYTDAIHIVILELHNVRILCSIKN